MKLLKNWLLNTKYNSKFKYLETGNYNSETKKEKESSAEKEISNTEIVETAKQVKNTPAGKEMVSGNDKIIDEIVPDSEKENKSVPIIKSTDIINKLKENTDKLPADIREKVLDFLDNGNIDVSEGLGTDEKLKEIENQINISLLGENTHVQLSLGEHAKNELSFNLENIKEKNPFPDGLDSIQQRLSNANRGRDAKGSITNEGMRYYDNNGNLKIDETVTLTKTLENDLSILKQFNITPKKLQNLVLESSSTNHFSEKDAAVIVNAINGISVDETDVQIAFSNISENFKTIINGVDGKYGQNTRKGVRTLGLKLADLIAKKSEIPVDMLPITIEKQYVIQNRIQSFGGGDVSGYADEVEVKTKIRKQELDEKSISGKDNFITVSTKDSNGTWKTVLMKNGKRMITSTPKDVVADDVKAMRKKESADIKNVEIAKKRAEQKAEKVAKNKKYLAEKAAKRAAIKAAKEQ